MGDFVAIVRARLADGRTIADGDVHKMVSEIERLRSVVDACNVTALIAHAIQDGMINEKAEGAFAEALDRMNEALRAAGP